MKKNLLLLLALASQLIWGQSNIKLNEKAPKINITDWIQNVPKDKSLENKFIVLEFWATWCGPCIQAVPHLNEIQSKFKQKDLYFISITDESVEKVERILKRIPFQSIVVSDTSQKTQIGFGNGTDGLEAYPMTILIDKKGIIKWIGMPMELNEKIITAFLNNTLTPYNVFEAKDTTEISEKENYDTKNVVEPEDAFDVFMKIAKNKNITYLFELEKTDSNQTEAIKTGNNAFHYSSLTVKELFTEILGYSPLLVEIKNNEIASNRYSLTYKNGNPKLKKNLENDFLEILSLNKTIVNKEIKLNIISIKKRDLLEEALDKESSSQSDAGDNIIFTGITLKNLVAELNKKTTELFDLNEKEDTKTYDFVINISSASATIKSLQSYGLAIKSTTTTQEVMVIE